MNKEWSKIAEENCTCQDREKECCPAHYSLWFNSYIQGIEDGVRIITGMAEGLKKLEERRKTWITRKTTTISDD